MDRLFWFIMEFLDALALGRLSRWGEPDPEAIRQEREDDRECDRLARRALVGGLGVAVTALRPSGKIAVGGRTFEATSEVHFIDRGTEIEVIGTRGPTFIVRARVVPSHDVSGLGNQVQS